MRKNNFPRITEAKQKGLGGQTYFQNLIINEWGWLYHKIEQENDFGIDAFIEIVNDGNVTGKKIGVQIKHGDSYFINERNNRILYNGEQKHINYYQNSNVPIIIVIMNNNFTRIFWRKFDINKILPTETGWSFEILCEQITKKDIKKIAGPIIDFTDEMNKIHGIHQLLNSTDFHLLVIPKEDIENFNYSKIINHIDFLTKNSKILEQKHQSFDICIYGYDQEPKELYEIPEVMMWFRKSIELAIPWFYFLSTGEKDVGLFLLLCSTLEKIKYTKVNNGYVLSIPGEDIGNFLIMNYPILNKFMENNGLNIELNKKICKNIVNKIESQFYSKKDSTSLSDILCK